MALIDLYRRYMYGQAPSGTSDVMMTEGTRGLLGTGGQMGGGLLNTFEKPDTTNAFDALSNPFVTAGAFLYGAGERGQTPGSAIMPSALQGVNLAETFRKTQDRRSAMEAIKTLDQTGLTELEKAILKISPLEGAKIIANRRKAPEKSVSKMTEAEKESLGFKKTDQVSAIRDRSGNIIDYKVGTTQETRFGKIAKAVKDSKLQEADDALVEIENFLGDLNKKGTKNIPGVGIVQGLTPDVLTSREGKKARALISKYINITLKARSGAAVTPSEYGRVVDELAGAINTADERVLIDVLNRARKALEKQKRQVFAAYDTEDIQAYQDAGGLNFVDSPLMNIQFGGGEPANAFSDYSDEELNEMLKKLPK